RKKKCIRYMESVGGNNGGSTKDDQCNDLDDEDGQRSDEDDEDDNEHDNLGSSGDDMHKGRDEDNESLNHSISSPGGLSGLSSLQSPSTSLASPLSLLTSPTMPQHGNGLLQTPINEQLQQHQHHMQVLQAQKQHLNQQLLQQTKLHHHTQHQQSGQLQHQQTQTITGVNSIATVVSTYESGVINTADIVTTILPTLSTSSSSSSGSASGYGSASSCSTNTSSISSPASLSDRMVRSLLSSSPAMLLGNRIGHIAMGLAMSNNNINASNNSSNSINISDNTYNTLAKTLTTDGSGNDGILLTTEATISSTHVSRPPILTSTAAPLAVTAAATATTSLKIMHSESSDRAINTTTVLTSNLSPSISPVASSAASSPSATDSLTVSINTTINNSNHVPIAMQRNPIGANPRDINNPLSINQLTKRPREEINDVSNSSSNNSINNDNNTCTSTTNLTEFSSTTTTANVFNHLQQATHHPTQTALTLPPPHNAMFSNNFTQHFTQQFGHHLATAAAAAAIASTPMQSAVQTPRSNNGTNAATNSSNKTSGNNVTNSGMSVNLDVTRGPTSETTATNESGAISVT
ncbi:hypothetical protein DOY81_009215, partial [Sarcophaga bullata]